jgi:hypothetical protein
MGGHHEGSGRLLTPESGGRKVDGIERAQRNRQRLRRARGDRAGDVHDSHGLEDPVDCLTPLNDLRFGDSLDEPQPIRGPETLHLHEGAGNPALDGAPFPERSRLPQDHT